MNTQNLR